jgi:carbon starvation protein CstA
MALDDRRATPAERLRDGHDFEPSNKVGSSSDITSLQ